MTFTQKISNWYFKKEALPYWGILFLDCFIIFCSYWLTYLLFRPKVLYWPLWGETANFLALVGSNTLQMLLFTLFYLVGFRLFRTYAGVLRYSSFVDLLRISGAMLIGGCVSLIVHFPLFEDAFSIRSRDIVVATMMATFILWMERIVVKFFYDHFYKQERGVRAFIYGVKGGGIGLAKSIANEKPSRFRLHGFVSDPDEYENKILMGKSVYPLDGDLIRVMQDKRVRAFLVSPLKNAAFRNNVGLQNALLNAGIRIFMVPKATEWNLRDKEKEVLQEVEIEDLLPREEIKVNLEEVGNLLREKCVLITGSAGSIGSEMVRQIASFSPSRMILIDQAETPQHDIRLMMQKTFPDIQTESIVSSICRPEFMETVFRDMKPDYVFHAAAYKHVPMMEDNPSESVLNNILGTRIIADLSVRYGVKKFVMVSTDKAVNPTNVMGCSKRICEIYVQSLDAAIKSGRVKGETQFVTTRFGNVLGSNGSVIPLFRKQIRAGGPVTVTHPDIIRYFMLIPEACNLVLEAGTMGNGGEIYVFDMGQPVRIADLAERMIKLSGAENVEIKYTGLRPGEKLYEEVLDDKETVKPTFHKKIKIAQVREYDYGDVCRQLDELTAISLRYDNMQTVRKMKQIVPEYISQNSVYESLDKGEKKEK